MRASTYYTITGEDEGTYPTLETAQEALAHLQKEDQFNREGGGSSLFPRARKMFKVTWEEVPTS